MNNNRIEQIGKDANELEQNSRGFLILSGASLLVAGVAEFVDHFEANDISTSVEAGGFAGALIFGAAAVISKIQATSTRRQLK